MYDNIKTILLPFMLEIHDFSDMCTIPEVAFRI